MRKVVIAGAGSGVGKTTITTGLMHILSRRYKVQGFKVGPDFIDPGFHTAATGRRSRNLDSFFMDHDTIRELFGWATRDADIAIIEGVRGLYDGLTATGDQGSTAEIAKILDAPVILVLNARSLAKSAAAVVKGFKTLDPEVRVEGVILNQVSGERHRQKAVQAVEQLTDTEVIGVIERRRERLPERHLGLVTVEEKEDVSSILEDVSSMAASVDMERLLDLAEKGAGGFPSHSPFPKGEERGVRIAVPRDGAYSFYYQENLESIIAAGGEVVEFSPLAGDPLPDADGYYIGGGYPEVHRERIAENCDFLEGLRTASLDGKLVYAECGGLITLCNSIREGDRRSKMAGVFGCDALLTAERQGLSYVRARGTDENFLFHGMEIRGHEFHYTRLDPLPSGPFGYSVSRGTGIDGSNDGLMVRRTIGAYLHQHALSNKDWGLAFVRAASAGAR
jgi:cobyrinic acid a,c-diamide synthase